MPADENSATRSPDRGSATQVLPLLLSRFTLRHWRMAPGQTALLVLILALGVAVFVSVRLANRAAVASFAHFTETLTGQSDWTVQPAAGGLPESVLPEIRAALGTLPVHLIPLIETTASLSSTQATDDRLARKTFTVLGLDLVGLANLARPQDRSFFGRAGDGPKEDSENSTAFWSTLGGRPRVWISRDFGSAPPSSVNLSFDERPVEVPVAGSIPTAPGAPAPPANLLIFDLPHLQTLLDRRRSIDRIEVLVETGPQAEAVRERTRVILTALGQDGQRWSVTPPGTKRETAETMTRAFRLNLTILSLIALLVGLYLIFQGLDGAVVRRRTEIAVLRSLGVEAGSLRAAWLLESALLGVVGGALGLFLGWAGAQISVRAVGRTVNALYYATTVDSAHLTWAEVGVGLLVGVGAALIAGGWPAHLASLTPPAQLLHRNAPLPTGRRGRNLAIGLALLFAGGLLARAPAYTLPGGVSFPIAGYATALVWIVGAGWICAYLLPVFARLARGLGSGSVSVRFALSHLRLPTGRHRLAVAALLCAIGMTAGMAILVASFELTVRGWIERALHADLYLSSRGAASASAQNRISATAARALGNHPGVALANTLAAYPITLNGLPTTLSGTDVAFWRKHVDQPWVRPPLDEDVFDSRRNSSLVVVSESFSERYKKRMGDKLDLPTPSGPQRVTVAGIFADYGNERGSVVADRVHVEKWFSDETVTHLSLYVRPGVNPDALRAELQASFPGLSILTNSTLRAEILRIFRQTFAITYALEAIGVLVAIVGLGLTLASVLLDRRDELTTLRALGFARAEIASATAIEGLAVSVCATLGGLLLSLGLGWLLIYVINKQSFGWTLGFALPWAQLAGLAFGICLTGTVVSYFVGRWGAALPADREE